MKKLIIVILMIFLLLAVYAMKNPFSIEEFSAEGVVTVVASTGSKAKVVTESVDIEKIVALLNNLEMEDLNSVIKTDHQLDFEFYDDGDNVINTISILGEIAFYNGLWYKVDPELASTFDILYNELSYPEEENTLYLEIESRRNERRVMDLPQSLEGTWTAADEKIVLEFSKSSLLQGGNKYNFSIDEESDQKLVISIYGTKGLLVKDRKLYELSIIFDDTKTNAQVRKVVNQFLSSDLVYHYNLIYIDEDRIPLGRYNDPFFSKDFLK